MKKTVIQEMIDFVTSDEYNHLYPNVKQEWFNTFLEKEKQQIVNAFDSGDFMCGAKERVSAHMTQNPLLVFVFFSCGAF